MVASQAASGFGKKPVAVRAYNETATVMMTGLRGHKRAVRYTVMACIVMAYIVMVYTVVLRPVPPSNCQAHVLLHMPLRMSSFLCTSLYTCLLHVFTHVVGIRRRHAPKRCQNSNLCDDVVVAKLGVDEDDDGSGSGTP